MIKNIDKIGIACTVPRLDVPIRPRIALYDLDMRRYIISIASVYSYVIIIRTARHVQKYVTDSDFDNDNITIRYFLSTYNINYVT